MITSNMDGKTDYPDKEETGDWTETEARESTVSDYRCVWCKLPMPEWDESVPAHELDTGESLCGSCLRDLRKYKRCISWLFIKHQTFDGTEVDEIMERHLAAMKAEVHEWFSDNAEDYPGMTVAEGTSNAALRELESTEFTATDGGEETDAPE